MTITIWRERGERCDEVLVRQDRPGMYSYSRNEGDRWYATDPGGEDRERKTAAIALGVTVDDVERVDRFLCPFCREAVIHFKDALSVREFRISKLCQKCQDGYFDEPPDPFAHEFEQSMGLAQGMDLVNERRRQEREKG
tara:strand:- start:148 stop:564 length:417 start_codon:yes stop_codon:yes gene_type:complete